MFSAWDTLQSQFIVIVIATVVSIAVEVVRALKSVPPSASVRIREWATKVPAVPTV